MVRGSFSSIAVVCGGLWFGGMIASSMVATCEAAFGTSRTRMTSRRSTVQSDPNNDPTMMSWSQNPIVGSSSRATSTTGGHRWISRIFLSSSKDVVTTSQEEVDQNDSKDAEAEAAVMGGVVEFERWFATISSSFASGNSASNQNKMKQVTHAAFEGVRGLQYLGGGSERNKGQLQTLLTVPSSMVLQTSFDAGWDVRLAMQLLNECAKGRKSSFYGYCSLLMRGEMLERELGTAPPSTAPDALRNWDPEQRQRLTKSSKGAKLLDAYQRQEERWRAAHADDSNSNKYSLEQFVWAMEAVHSRAFKGDFGKKLPFRTWAGILTPVAAGAIGFNFLLQDYNGETGGAGPVSQNNGLAAVCAAIAFLPVLLNFAADQMESSSSSSSGESSKRNHTNNAESAVLLPLIDSANHIPTAESRLEFDPLSKSFSVSIDPNTCIDPKTQQLFISYGIKTDAELLLNYGFLPSPNNNVLDSTTTNDNDNHDNDPKRDAHRAALAKAFVQRNP
eukprot:scaffold66535_cov40-Attheya_sp.AAC.3